MWLPKSEQQQVSRLSDWRTFLQWWEVIKEWEKDLQKWSEGSVLVTFVFAVTNTRQEATQRKKRFILANSLRECSQSRWSSHSSESNSWRRWWKLAHIWMGQEADRRLETKMDYKQKVLPQSDTFPLSRHCLPKTHTPPHLPQTAPQLETKHSNTWTYGDYFTSKTRHQLHSRSAGARLRRAESWDETIHRWCWSCQSPVTTDTSVSSRAVQKSLWVMLKCRAPFQITWHT